MNVCIKYWSAAPRCTGSLMDQLHGASPGGLEAGVAILLLVGAAIAVFVFRNPA
ncbi:hypothetical protein [uncultured Jannaschia sp.]|uniref:hypothetical protein n=1 Tax=uncultured Jannaschia sp. TaxID=293347 RepID=UPI0026193A96|nr:hypothetical protein [uncultured Jannaschia sp.]